MSEIEVGEYVRTEYGISKLIEIRKVDGCEEQKIYIFDDISDELWSGDLPNELWKSEIEWHEEKFNNKIFLKHSKQLIDLIEEGDYVNGELITDKWDTRVSSIRSNFSEEDIKTILTKESYMANCYKVGGE